MVKRGNERIEYSTIAISFTMLVSISNTLIW